MHRLDIDQFTPPFEDLDLSDSEKEIVSLFFTNSKRPVFSTRVPFPPELIGAICSRTSRAKGDLREVFAREYVAPFAEDKSTYGDAFRDFVTFLKEKGPENVFSNPKAREFYVKWLADYGDDSIAQMAGTYLFYSGLSQVAIKHIEDMRIGIAPIEQSTRYVDYSTKVNGTFRYYTDPTLKEMGLENEYRKVMDHVFETYTQLREEFAAYLQEKYPNEKPRVYNTKTFDTIRGILPTATLSQVAFFANGQSLEYFLARSLDHNLGEIRWAASGALKELKQTIPSFLRRAENETASDYREYKSALGKRIRQTMEQQNITIASEPSKTQVSLVDYDKNGENMVIAALLFPETHASFASVLQKVEKASVKEKEAILQKALAGRDARWKRMPRAFEMASLTIETVMNIGAWRDEHRHRMKTQIRQYFTVENGFDVPQELVDAGLDGKFCEAIKQVEELHGKIAAKDQDLAQYATVLAHRLRFMQKTNLRSLFWETELRSGSQGHPDYRKTAQEKAKLIQKVYPLLGKYLMVDMQDYAFARRGTEERIQKKEAELRKMIQGS